MGGTFMVPQHTILHCKRVAVRPIEGEPWQWFSPVIYFTISGYFTNPQWYYPAMVLESFYEEALCHELERRGIPHERQYAVQVFSEGVTVGTHQLDLFVANEMVVELKAVKAIEAAHFSKVRSYLRAVGRQHGLILNFALPRLEIKRVIAGRGPSPAFLTSCFPDEKTTPRSGD